MRRCLEEETDAEIADQVGGDIGSSRSNVTGDKIDSLGRLHGVSRSVVCDTTVDKLRSLGRGSERCAVSDGTSVNAHESKDDTENASKNSESGVHVELKLADDDSNGQEDKSSNNPDPDRDLLLGGSKVFDEVTLVSLVTLLLEEGVVFALGLEAVVEGARALAESVLEAIPDDAEVEEELNERVYKKNHNTGPQHPVPR